MLGSGFFQEYTGVKRDKQLRTYDHTAFVMEEQADDPEGTAEAFWTTDDIDDETLEAMAAEDEDAALILQFEDAMADTIQNDSDLTAFYSTYQDARRRLSERVRVKGFWPIRKGEKGKTKAFKGKGKGKSRPGSLAHRIANSYCRICFQKGHWKDECPKKTGSGSSNPAAAPTSFVVAHEIPSEIQHLPVLTTVAEETRHCGSVVSRRLYKVDNQYRNRGNAAHNRVRMSDRINKTGIEDSTALKKTYFPKKDKEIHNIASRFVHGLQLSLRKTQPHPGVSEDISVRQSSVPDPDSSVVECHFASVGTVGVVDLGASQTVIGSNQVPDLLAKLEPTIRKQVHRTSCNLVFRFGNHQTLTSHHALMLPLHGEWFRIAVVPGQTPFLLSSQFLKQTLKAVIDTDAGTLWSKTLNKHIPLIASNKNLFLLDLNHLWESDHNPLSFMCSDEQVQESNLTHQPSPSERDWKNHECKSGVCSDKDKSPKVVEDTEVQDTISSGARFFKHDHMTMTSNSLPSDQDRVSPIEFPSAHHVDTLPKIQGVQEAVHRTQWRTGSSRCESDGLGRTLQRSDKVWDHPRWQNLSGDVRKPHLDTMVPVQLRNLKQGGSCQVLPVLRAEARHGDGTGLQGCQDQGLQEWKGQDAQVEADASGTNREVMDPCGARGTMLGSGTRFGGYHGGQHVVADAADGRSGPSHPQPEPSPVQSYEPCGDGPARDSQSPEEHSPEVRAMSEEAFLSDLLDFDCDFDHVCFAQHKDSFMRKCQQWCKLMGRELEQVSHELSSQRPSMLKTDVFEVMCGSQSELTKQCQLLGGRASRFGLSEGDLSKTEGRRRLFRELLTKDPTHLWYSPKCSPWCKFSNLSMSKSPEAFASIMKSREDSL